MKSNDDGARARRQARLGLALLLVIGIGGAHGRQTDFASRSTDPLTMPRPGLDEPLILPIDSRAPAQKIVATMPAALRELADPSSARVIVTLHEPLASSRLLSRTRREAVRLARIAAVEHDFVDAASRLGFRASNGLSHFAIVTGEISPERLPYLAALRQVRAIEPDRAFRAARVEGAALIRADDLRDDLGGGGEGVTVVVFDSGINASHPELAGKVVEQRSYNGPAGQDGFDHGTQVAGIIAGDGGVAPQAQLWDVRVISSDGMTTTAILIDALDGLMPDLDEFQVMVAAFADPTFRFSGSCDALSPAAATVVQAFEDAGKLMVSAAGDAGDSAGVGVPACLSQVFAAGAVYDANVGSITFANCTDSSTGADQIACYSNSGPPLDFLAPGHCTSTPRSNGGHDGCFGGTSAAAAYAAGMAAQLWSLLPSATLEQVGNALRTQGPMILDSRNGISRPRIDAMAAYESLAAVVGPTPTATSPAPGPSPTPTKTPTGPVPTPTPPPDDTPGPPTDLTAQALTHTAVLLEWVDGSSNEESFRIEARTATGIFQELLTVPADTTFAIVEQLFPGTEHVFRVRARAASGNSSYSNEAGATTAAEPPTCIRDANTACLLDGRFRVTGAMKNFATPPVTFVNQTMEFAGGRAESDQAVFFESFAAGNFEVGVKMVDGCAGFPPGHPLHHYWLFFGGLTNARTDIAVEDTATGQIVTWTNPANQFPTSVADTRAFPCVDPGGPLSCIRDDTTACLLGGRFEVTGAMQNFATPPVTFVTEVIHFDQDRAETDSAVFFQSFDPGNFEVGVKMVDGCAGFPPGHPLHHFWIFYGGLTNADTEVLAIDTSSGEADIWRNPPGALPTSEGRTRAFSCVP
ncbi:MAG TPA: S8 family serine peptidase [Thermoanaerobaculia bacterium]|nr:S8 family serine peptidase [Thermoanaerobaculia bacterium]